MSDPADKLTAQGPIVASRAERQVQFISDALRAGERAILVSGRDPFSTRVPDAALAACVSTSVRVLHIGRPLPEQRELQEMIGAAAGIAGSREMEPHAMARRLVTADPRQAVVLAIDDADTLPPQSLYYLALMSDLLAKEWPALQIVFAAGPALLTRPEFETFRNRIFAGGLMGPLARANTQSIAPQSVELPPMVLLRWRLHRVFGARAPAVVVIAMSCLIIICCLAFLGFYDDLSQSPAPAVKPGALQELAGGTDPSVSAPPLDPRQTDEVIAALIDKAETVIARGSFGWGPDEDPFTLFDRIGTLAASASPVGRKLALGIPERFSAKAFAAISAGRVDEARRLELLSDYFQFVTAPTALAGFVGANPRGAPSQRIESALAQAPPPSGTAPPSDQRDAADRPILFPKVAAPTAPGTLPESPAPAVKPGALQEFAGGVGPSLSAPPLDPRQTDEVIPNTAQWEAEAGIACPPRDTFENAQAWVHERLNCERHPTPSEPWIEWAEYCPVGPLGYFVLKVKTGQQKVYLFENIPPAVWEGFKAAPAAGKYYHSEIKGKRHWFRLASELKPSTCRR